MSVERAARCAWNAHWEQTGDDEGWCIYPWGSNAAAYDQTSQECESGACGGRMVKCPNWKFCHRQMPFDMLDCFGQRCSKCDPELGRNFQFVEAKGDCPVCFETSSDRMVFPGCPGGHCFCINCVKTALFGSYDDNVAILAEVSTEEHDADEDYDPSEESERLRGMLSTTKSCPLCRAPSTAPWLLRMRAEGRA